MKHPFLENTYLNIAIFNRSNKKFGEALMMWKRLESLQKDIYGDKSMTLLYTYKNIGTSYMGIGDSEQAREYFEKALKLLDETPCDLENKAKFETKDKEEKS